MRTLNHLFQCLVLKVVLWLFLGFLLGMSCYLLINAVVNNLVGKNGIQSNKFQHYEYCYFINIFHSFVSVKLLQILGSCISCCWLSYLTLVSTPEMGKTKLTYVFWTTTKSCVLASDKLLKGWNFFYTLRSQVTYRS